MSPEFPFELPLEVAESLEKMILPETFPPPAVFNSTGNDEEPAFMSALLNWTHELRCGYFAIYRLMYDHLLKDEITTVVEREADQGFMYLDTAFRRSIERGEVLINWIRTTWPYDPAIRKQFGNGGKPIEAPTQ